MKTNHAASYAAEQATPKPSDLRQQPLFSSRFGELAIRPGLSRVAVLSWLDSCMRL